MGKSIRSKSKRSFRAKKREDSVYAAVHAARLNRLNKKLMDITLRDADGDAEIEEVSEFEDEKDGSKIQDDTQAGEAAPAEDAMELDGGAAPSTSSSKRISTHGPRNSRREEWRKAKGLPPRPKGRSINRQGLVSAVRKSGRSKRRR